LQVLKASDIPKTKFWDLGTANLEILKAKGFETILIPDRKSETNLSRLREENLPLNQVNQVINQGLI